MTWVGLPLFLPPLLNFYLKTNFSEFSDRKWESFCFKPQPSGICWVASSIFDRGLYDGGACDSWGLDREHFGHGKFFCLPWVQSFNIFFIWAVWSWSICFAVYFLFSENISFFDLWKAMGCILKRSFGFDFIKWVVGRKGKDVDLNSQALQRSMQSWSPQVGEVFLVKCACRSCWLLFQMNSLLLATCVFFLFLCRLVYLLESFVQARASVPMNSFTAGISMVHSTCPL